MPFRGLFISNLSHNGARWWGNKRTGQLKTQIKFKTFPHRVLYDVQCKKSFQNRLKNFKLVLSRKSQLSLSYAMSLSVLLNSKLNFSNKFAPSGKGYFLLISFQFTFKSFLLFSLVASLYGEIETSSKNKTESRFRSMESLNTKGDIYQSSPQ